MTEFQEKLAELFSAYEIPAGEEQLAALERYAELLCEWNEKMNLTAIVDPEGIRVKHFLDSALALRYLQISGKVIDVGTGAGFPGIVWGILRPELEITLLDSLQKRLTFLETVCRELGVNAKLVHARAEAAGRDPALRGKFDCATARAVAGMNVLCEYCMPFVKTGGILAALKGPQMEEEMQKAERAVKLLGGQVERVESYELPGGDQRRLAIVRKKGPTGKEYPRHGGKIKKAPL